MYVYIVVHVWPVLSCSGCVISREKTGFRWLWNPHCALISAELHLRGIINVDFTSYALQIFLHRAGIVSCALSLSLSLSSHKSRLSLFSSGSVSGPWVLKNSSINSGELVLGQRISQDVPPGVFWRSLLHLRQPHFLKFNISLGKDALFGVYMRKGLPPSHAQVSESPYVLCLLLKKLHLYKWFIHLKKKMIIDVGIKQAVAHRSQMTHCPLFFEIEKDCKKTFSILSYKFQWTAHLCWQI